ncbi:hypothetical protein SC1_00974 [Sphingopyxis sp. C-1]|nr:hypothetical protein SC1_00974 [Sphingopyxis sp. C-1]
MESVAQADDRRMTSGRPGGHHMAFGAGMARVDAVILSL